MNKVTRINATLVKSVLPKVRPADHKGNRGHALMIGGSYGKMGAICLAAEAALRAGCGLVTAQIPRCGYDILQTRIPEVMTVTDNNSHVISDMAVSVTADAIGIGPGMGTRPETANAFDQFLRGNMHPLVIDADAINLLAANPALHHFITGCILTPHSREFERLTSGSATVENAQSFSEKFNFIVVLKGASTHVITPAAIFQNTTGNVALATGGSGDVLTGIIAGFLAQGLPPADAATAGVFVHGLTADLATVNSSRRSFIASDILRYLGKALHAINR